MTNNVISEDQLVKGNQQLDGNLTVYGTGYFRGLLTMVSASIASLAATVFTGVEVWGTTAQTLTGAGAVNLTTPITWLVTTAADALTLANGAEGQVKFIVMKTDGGDGTLTPTSMGNGSTITFDDAGDCAHLLFTNGKWYFMGGTATRA